MRPEDYSIKNRLGKTWHPFFGHFGKFTEIQSLTIPHILAGENVVVISPAATGKTEAVIAPLVERLIQRKALTPNKLSILYVSPTRALVNDLFRRLIQPLSCLHIKIGIKTGDYPALTLKKLPRIILTTPESFDSLLTRQTGIFEQLNALVLDELHLIDNTPRGDQLRILLNRLRRITKNIQCCALSATIDDINIGKRYFENPRVCILQSPKEIEYLLISQDRFVRKLLATARARGIKKMLIFFNARSYAESFSRRLNQPPFEGRVLVHHASLTKNRREEVEKTMIQNDRAILCATSTLELGIDIGDIDCIVLHRPPHNISSLLQRIGRGNRRQNKLFAVGIYKDNLEKMLFESYFECARQGSLFSERYNPTLSIIPQQIYSYLYQRRRIGTTLKSLYRIFEPIYTALQVKTVFKKLLDDGLIKEFRPGIYYDSEKLEKKIAWGKIHSNIAEINFGEYDVFDISQNRIIGRIFYVRNQFILGGRCWQTVQVQQKERRVYAKYVQDIPALARIFEGKGERTYNYLLAPILKSKLFPELDGFNFPFTYDGRNTHILHLFGALYGFILAEALSREGIETIDLEGKLFILKRFQLVNQEFPAPRVESIRKVINDNIRRLEDALGSGAYFYDLPLEYQIEDHYRALDINGFLNFLNSINLVPIDKDKFYDIAKGLK